MPLTTTTLGAYPKPDDLPIKDWFQVGHDSESYEDDVLRAWDRGQSPEAEAILDAATAQAVQDQIDCGIDLPTDGEQRRDNYVHYQCRHFDGIDFHDLTAKTWRGGAMQTTLPTIRGKVTARNTARLVKDWRVAEAAAGRPVKITLPGPMTISDTTADAYYDDPEAQARDLAAALNMQIRALADAGCTNIQVDEPVFARKPQAALDYGIDTLGRCFEGLPNSVTRVMHMCCGYPNRLDQTDYPKADPNAYLEIAEALDGTVDQISIEDAHRHNPDALFSRFTRSKLIVGFVTIAQSRVEPLDQVKDRMRAILKHVPEERLIAAPDCGLGFLGRDLAMTKLKVLTEAARAV